ncbi:bifunctional UDP-sugar hydrolase/5'-nucleotidase UshA [Rhodoferax aquaticus]|uniref:Bifunctional UDP-sugar hydrolase/5'-nucleotidase n=1 Tax=Rhodoferax aquaticus TaxID=2527691 RepID=A0A515ESE8_9BURK|nr:bifunctional UDP-sugar hydrolase/5'-nucleotidase UshA [Rhodoferax aquaticus]QDL55596.1 bifunctional UDP-sugar hydrolase/5'-nucleotidase [Rhodoferax aquaticus]
MQRITFTLSAIACIALAGCSSLTTSGPAPDKTYMITVLHTNDHHGRFWKNRDGEYGMAARKTVIDSIRSEVQAKGGYSLLLDGGDVNTGVPESDLQDAVPDFRGMNLLGYDAMAVGNHEFDKPPTVLKMQRALATFPMLSANIYRKGERAFDPYKVFNLGGVRVAVVGLTTEDTQKMVHPDNIRDMEFRNPIQEAAKVVPELRGKADVVIAATHMGHYANGNHGTQAPGDVEMARAVKGIDLVVGGHTQNPACMKAENVLDTAYVPGAECQPDRQNGTWIVQAHEWGKYVGRADFEYRNGEFKLVKYSLVPINLKKPVKAADGKTTMVTYTPEIAENKDMLALLQPFQDFGQKQLLVEVGSTDGKLEGDRSVVRTKPTALGVMIGQAMMEKTRADFAVMNSGGVRDSLPAGKLNYKDVLTVHPFGNTVCVVELTGKEVLDFLNAAVKMSPGSGAFPQFAGVKLLIESNNVKEASIAGKSLEAGKTYRMAINNFVAAGGDGYPKLTGHPSFVDTGYVDADVLRSYITNNSPLRAAQYDPADSVVRK